MIITYNSQDESEHDTSQGWLPDSELSEQLVCLTESQVTVETESQVTVETESQVTVETAGVRGSGKHLLCKWTAPFYPISSSSFNYPSHPLFPEQTHPMYSAVVFMLYNISLHLSILHSQKEATLTIPTSSCMAWETWMDMHGGSPMSLCKVRKRV